MYIRTHYTYVSFIFTFLSMKHTACRTDVEYTIYSMLYVPPALPFSQLPVARHERELLVQRGTG